jgi:hypothetical protein
MPQNPSLSSSRCLYALVAAGGLLLVALLFIPEFDGPHFRQHANEAVAVSKLRTVTTLEKNFTAAHGGKGFACELPLLRPAESEQHPVDHDLLRFLTTGTSEGYTFVLGNCRADAKGVVVHYEATAVPVEPGKTGFHAFCTDDSGLLWYDKDGSATNCLASRRGLQE